MTRFFRENIVFKERGTRFSGEIMWGIRIKVLKYRWTGVLGRDSVFVIYSRPHRFASLGSTILYMIVQPIRIFVWYGSELFIFT